LGGDAVADHQQKADAATGVVDSAGDAALVLGGAEQEGMDVDDGDCRAHEITSQGQWRSRRSAYAMPLWSVCSAVSWSKGTPMSTIEAAMGGWMPVSTTSAPSRRAAWTPRMRSRMIS